MSTDLSQFHQGMSNPDFLGRFGTETQCAKPVRSRAGQWVCNVAMVVGVFKPRPARLQVVNTALGNLKPTVAGAFHSLKYRKYVEQYRAAFAYRFNRRFDLRDLVVRLITDILRGKPAKELAIRTHAKKRF